MTKKSMLLAGAAMLLSAAATPAVAQSTIAPGMTTEQVRDRFGAPATTRAQGDWTYWYYHNGCPVRCGSDDVVFFQNERVVAAVLRTSRRRFSGPAPDDALARAEGAGAPADERVNDASPARVHVGGVRVDGPPADAAPAPEADRPRPRAREGQPGEPSTIIITQDPTPAARVDVPVNEAREARPGEPSTIRITTPPAAEIEPNIQIEAPRPGEQPVPPSHGSTPAAGTNPPEVDGRLPTTPAPAARPAPTLPPGVRLENQPQLRPRDPAENTEAADTRGETSIDRKTRRERQDRANEETATQRARRNDGRNP